MTRVVGILAAGVLFGLAALHAYWAAGGDWGTDAAIPTRDGAPLFKPGPVGTVLVAVLLCAAALVLLGRLGIWGRRCRAGRSPRERGHSSRCSARESWATSSGSGCSNG